MFDVNRFTDIAPDTCGRLYYHNELGSTNDEARRLAELGVDDGAVVLADYQTHGRGRRGATWLSEPGKGLLFTIILRPAFDREVWGRIALMTGLGIVTAFRQCWEVSAELKWPNDVYLMDRKCAGILTEVAEDYALVGVGLNVLGVPQNVDGLIGTVALGDVCKISLSREEVLACVLEEIFKEIGQCEEGFEGQLERLREVFYLMGRDVEFFAGRERLRGRVQGLSDQGELLVEREGVCMSFAQASEIRLV